MGNNKWFKKFTEWEYWPSYMFYLPNIPYVVYLAIKARDFTFYSVVNPGVKNSGNGTESKFETLELIPENLKPKSILISTKISIEEVIKKLHHKGIDYPIIVKPDIGFRGMLVKKIVSDKGLAHYLDQYPIPVILQEFIDLPNECGIFYHRMPDSDKGSITSITIKSFITIIGNGVSSLSELVQFDKRARHYYALFKKLHLNQWDRVLHNGEELKLTDIGNHNKGTQFINGNHLIDTVLEETLDKINANISGWYYGRLDIKYNSIEELKQGKNFCILEINGTISEPTHIYDPYHTTYFKALKSIRRHWSIMRKVNLMHK